jgi:predicted PurR-regulated permease PerM
MTNVDSSAVDQKFLANTMASFLQIGAVLILLTWCYQIVSPFANVMIWAVILSIAVYPSYVALAARLGGRTKLSATIIILIGITLIAAPALMLAESTIGGLKTVATELADGTAVVPPPADSVAEWPVIGERVHQVWSAAATNLEATLNQFEPQLRSAGRGAISFAGHTAASLFLFVFAVIIAGVLWTSASGSYKATTSFAASLMGTDRGRSMTDLAILTIRSVAKGILGIAFIQSISSGILLLVAGVPGAGLWAGAVLVLAIVQLPPLIILGPIAIWYFSVADPVSALIFLVFATIVSVSDTFLKPFLLGRGVETPMLVILIGAIGGAIVEGIMGLFTGAVILALGYELLIAWMAPDETVAELQDG